MLCLFLTSLWQVRVFGAPIDKTDNETIYRDAFGPLTRLQIIGVLSAVDLEDPILANLMERVQAAGTNILPVIHDVLDDSTDSYLVTRTLQLVRRMGKPDTHTLLLVRQLASRLPDVENNVIATLGDIGDETDISRFVNALHSENWRTRIEASKALVKRGDIEAAVQMDRALREYIRNKSDAEINKDSSLLIGFQSLKELNIRLLDEQISAANSETDKQSLMRQKQAIIKQPDIPPDIIQRNP